MQKKWKQTCVIFQLHFYENLFTSSFASLIVNYEKLTKTTIHKLLNEIFKLDNRCYRRKNGNVNSQKPDKFGI